MSDGITDGNRPPALCDVLEYGIDLAKRHGLTVDLNRRQAEEALQNCRDLQRIRERWWAISRALDATDKTERERLEWIHRIMSASQ